MVMVVKYTELTEALIKFLFRINDSYRDQIHEISRQEWKKILSDEKHQADLIETVILFSFR